MFETFKKDLECRDDAVEASAKFVIPEYLVLLGNLAVFQRLFRLKYREHVYSLGLLAELLGVSDVDFVVRLERDLEAYLCRVMGGSVRADLLELVCPSCFKLALTGFGRDGECIKKVCSSCGVEADDSYADGDDFDQSLDRDVTFAPVSELSWTKGMGGTLDMKRDGHKLLNDSSVPFEEFKAFLPDVAAELEQGHYFVCTESDVYHLMPDGRNVVRRVSLKDFFGAVDMLFHGLDLPLRKKKMSMASSVPNGLEKALGYGMELCRRYGFDRSDRDQALFNSVGNVIRVMKPQLKRQRFRCPEKRMVETLFYICLLRFNKLGKSVAARARSELDIDVGLLNYYVDYEEFLRMHEHVNTSVALIDVLERVSAGRCSVGAKT